MELAAGTIPADAAIRGGTEDAAKPKIPWALTASALLAFLSMTLTRREFEVPLLLGISVCVSWLVPARLALRSRTTRIIRFALYAAVAAITLAQPLPTNTSIAQSAQIIEALMQCCMAELALQFWLRHEPGCSGALLVLLTGFVFVAASKTFDRRYAPVLTPIFIILSALALHGVRARPGGIASGTRMKWLRPLLMLLTLSFGFTSATLIYRYRKKIDRTGFDIAVALQGNQKSVGFSSSPVLGEVHSAERSMLRLLRVDGVCPDPHLRGMAYYDYFAGRWDPPAENRGFDLLASNGLESAHRGPHMNVTRLTDDLQFLFLPLHSVGLQISQPGQLQRDSRGGSGLIFRAPAPLNYSVALSESPQHQGPLCIAMGAAQRESCLDVPPTIDPRVLQLARQIAEGKTDPRARVQAVEEYLRKNYAYSLTSEIGAGDPVSLFLLNKNAAHCEFFASGAVILLRCLNVPARYVNGFYAHESAGNKSTIVRAQDAHAWAEAWLEGTGWVTVDPTPPDGLPEKLAAVPSFWRRVAEWISDAWQELQAMKWQQAVVLAAPALLLVLLAVYRLRKSHKKMAPLPASVYTLPGDSLGALAGHFDALLQRWQLPCPLHLTWQEHLNTLASGNDGRGISPAQLDRARFFLSEYNAVRFGRPNDTQAIDRLRGMLREMER